MSAPWRLLVSLRGSALTFGTQAISCRISVTEFHAPTRCGPMTAKIGFVLSLRTTIDSSSCRTTGSMSSGPGSTTSPAVDLANSLLVGWLRGCPSTSDPMTRSCHGIESSFCSKKGGGKKTSYSPTALNLTCKVLLRITAFIGSAGLGRTAIRETGPPKAQDGGHASP